MLGRLQKSLSDTYQAEGQYDVRDFLITDPRMASALSEGNANTETGEALLLSEDEEGLAVSLYLEKELLERVRASDGINSVSLDDLCKVIEGVSHFHYVSWQASRDQAMTLLELELQAEVDKYVCTMQLASEQQDTELMNVLHRKIFDEVRYGDELDDEQLERYQAANEYAARFCWQLQSRFLQNPDALETLRRFFRFPLRQKISQIHAAAFAG